MGKPRRYCVLVLLVPALVICGWLAHQQIRTRRPEVTPPGLPTPSVGSVSDSMPSAPLWAHNRPVPAGKSLAAIVAAPEEIAKCAKFLCSDDASFITGTALVADGGSSAVDVGYISLTS